MTAAALVFNFSIWQSRKDHFRDFSDSHSDLQASDNLAKQAIALWDSLAPKKLRSYVNKSSIICHFDYKIKPSSFLPPPLRDENDNWTLSVLDPWICPCGQPGLNSKCPHCKGNIRNCDCFDTPFCSYCLDRYNTIPDIHSYPASPNSADPCSPPIPSSPLQDHTMGLYTTSYSVITLPDNFSWIDEALPPEDFCAIIDDFTCIDTPDSPPLCSPSPSLLSPLSENSSTPSIDSPASPISNYCSPNTTYNLSNESVLCDSDSTSHPGTPPDTYSPPPKHISSAVAITKKPNFQTRKRAKERRALHRIKYICSKNRKRCRPCLSDLDSSSDGISEDIDDGLPRRRSHRLKKQRLKQRKILDYG